MAPDRPRVKCFMARPLIKRDSTGLWWDRGNVIGEPVLVDFDEDAIAERRAEGYTMVLGPCPVGMSELAKWEREHGR